MRRVPNILTSIRILLIPVFIYFYQQFKLLSAGIFVFACITDLVDGYIARKYNAVSKFGILCDPLADKLLQISAVLCLCSSGILPLWVLILFFAKELLMVIGAIVLLSKNIVVPANKVGKYGSLLIFASVTYMLIVPAADTLTLILSYAMGTAAIVTLANYAFLFIKISHKKKAE